MGLLHSQTALITGPALTNDLQWLRQHDEQDENKHALKCIQQLKEYTRSVGGIEGNQVGDEAQRLDGEQETRGSGTAMANRRQAITYII